MFAYFKLNVLICKLIVIHESTEPFQQFYMIGRDSVFG